jgi:hypothetical protein
VADSRVSRNFIEGQNDGGISMTEAVTPIDGLERALTAIYLEVPKAVADDLYDKVHAALAAREAKVWRRAMQVADDWANDRAAKVVVGGGIVHALEAAAKGDK